MTFLRMKSSNQPGNKTNGSVTNGDTSHGRSTSGNTPNGSTTNGKTAPQQGSRYRPPTSRFEHFKFRRDYRASLPTWLSRFTGYRAPGEEAPYEPLGIPPFTWLHHIPLEVEIWGTAWIGSFVGILLIEAIMGANTAFQEIYHAPLIITSFGASAVLLFGVIESPVAQPRNFVGGHFISALTGTCITRLWVLNPRYHGGLDNASFHANSFVNGGLSMATSLLFMLMTGTAHPPAGATGLNAAVESSVVTLSWRYLPVVLASSLIMLGWAMIINNLGRRRYPLHWWAPGATFVSEQTDEVREMEEAKRRRECREEGVFRRESIASENEVIAAEEPEGQPGDHEPADMEDVEELWGRRRRGGDVATGRCTIDNGLEGSGAFC